MPDITLPLRVRPEDDASIIDANGHIVCETRFLGHREKWVEPANALIVRAVNCHDDLVALAETFKRTVEFYRTMDVAEGDDEGVRLKQVSLRMIEDVLAKAKGETP